MRSLRAGPHQFMRLLNKKSPETAWSRGFALRRWGFRGHEPIWGIPGTPESPISVRVPGIPSGIPSHDELKVAHKHHDHTQDPCGRFLGRRRVEESVAVHAEVWTSQVSGLHHLLVTERTSTPHDLPPWPRQASNHDSINDPSQISFHISIIAYV